MYSNCFAESCRLWDNVEKYGRQATDNIIERMRIAWCITKATDTHYVLLPTFSQQKWLRERASILLHAYIACHVHISRYIKVSV
jgi:hypothetical protein